MKKQFAGIAALAVLVGTPAMAADMQVKVPPPPTQPGAFYMSLDGSYQSINLPTFDLGFRVFPSGVFAGPGNALTSFDPRVSGAGGSGALGYVLPYGALPSVFGSNVRVEIGGSYIHAAGSQFAAPAFSANAPFVSAFTLLNGTPVESGSCPCGPVTISTAASLATDYAAWTVNGKVASDFRSGMLTATPSLMVFAGRARNEQSFDQRLFVPAFGIGQANTKEYSAQSDLAWTDVGVKAGLDLTAGVTDWLALGVGGAIGLAGRNVSLSASDSFSDTLFVPSLFGTSAIATSAGAIPFLAGANANITVRPLSAVSLRGFVGLNYDSAVPGIAAPQYVGTGGLNPVTTPAGIKFAHETSYYAGGGVTVRFGP